ncbi:hypothetical protein [Nostoc sp.]|uniref:hypothetical protein n=1 Tax=Nostoc sp. TaxID=1180 RepID=UPI002FFB0794
MIISKYLLFKTVKIYQDRLGELKTFGSNEKDLGFNDLYNQEFFAAIADNDAHVYSNMISEYNFI